MAHRAFTIMLTVVAIAGGVRLPAQASSHYMLPETPTQGTGGGLWSGIATGDLNGSGRDDFVMANAQFIYAFLTTANGTIGPPVVSTYWGVPAGGVDLYMPVLGDFNQDGNLDLVVLNGLQNQQRVFFGDGTGAFTWVADLPAIPFNGIHHRVADLDNDGIPEIVLWAGPTAPAGKEIHIFRFDPPTATFMQAALFTLPIGPPLIADYDGDGNLDMLGLSLTSPLSTMYVYLGDGNLGFSPAIPVNYSLPPGPGSVNLSIFAGDVDLDGKTDVVINHYPSPQVIPWSPSYVTVGRNLLASPVWSTFPSPGLQSTGAWKNSLHIVDVNGDGFPDLVGTQTGNLGSWLAPVPKSRFGVMLGDGAGAFSAPMVQEFSGTTWIMNFGVADFDMDGDPDFFGLDDALYNFTVLRNISRFGRGCSTAPIGAPIMSSNLLTPGNAGFQMRLGNAPAMAPALLAVSRGGYVANTSACLIGVDFSIANLVLPLGSLGIATTDALGSAAINLPVPADPALAGTTLFAQWGVVDATAPDGVAMSRAGTFVIW